jgi:hypothetical protein
LTSPSAFIVQADEGLVKSDVAVSEAGDPGLIHGPVNGAVSGSVAVPVQARSSSEISIQEAGFCRMASLQILHGFNASHQFRGGPGLILWCQLQADGFAIERATISLLEYISRSSLLPRPLLHLSWRESVEDAYESLMGRLITCPGNDLPLYGPVLPAPRIVRVPCHRPVAARAPAVSGRLRSAH